MSEFRIELAESWMPDGLQMLAAESREYGIRNVTAVVERWANGSEVFDRVGESLLVGVDPTTDTVIAVGGLTHCPHVPEALRVRRFYVSVEWRRRGVAGAMARQLIADGLQRTSTLTCNAQASAAAPPFWEAMGFVPTNIEGITHIMQTS